MNDTSVQFMNKRLRDGHFACRPAGVLALIGHLAAPVSQYWYSAKYHIPNINSGDRLLFKKKKIISKLNSLMFRIHCLIEQNTYI